MKWFHLIVPELTLHAGPRVLSVCLSLHGNWAEAAPVATYLNCLYFLRAAGWRLQPMSPGETMSLYHSSSSTELGKAGAVGREASCIDWSGSGDPAQGTGSSLGPKERPSCDIQCPTWVPHLSQGSTATRCPCLSELSGSSPEQRNGKTSVRDCSATKAAFFVPFIYIYTHI